MSRSTKGQTMSKYETRFYDSPNGGTLKRVHFRLWMARQRNVLGSLSFQTFDNEADAIAFADSDR